MPQERYLDEAGLLTLCDVEAGNQQLIDMRHKNVGRINAFLKERMESQAKLFMQHGVDLLDVDRGVDYGSDLITFFRKRMRHF